MNGGTAMPNPAAVNGTNKATGYTTTNNQKNNTGTDRGFVRITCLPYMKP